MLSSTATIKPITLNNETVSLVPLSLEHTDELIKAVRDGRLWELWYTNVPKPEGMRAEIERRLKLQQEGSMLPFTVVDNSNDKIVGMTTYMNIEADTPRLEIGSTWYAQSAHHTNINTACKLLLLQYAFEKLNCIAVEFRTHFLNQASRRAIERLGAKLDGILRNHRYSPNGSLRDTCVYSIINSEWPTIHVHLKHKLEYRNTPKI